MHSTLVRPSSVLEQSERRIGSVNDNFAINTNSSKIFQSLVSGISGVVPRRMGVIDKNKTIIACTEPQFIGTKHEVELPSSANSSQGLILSEGFTYKQINIKELQYYTTFCQGNDETAAGYVTLLSSAVSNLQTVYDEKYDTSMFVKNIVMDNILQSDIHFKAKEFNLRMDVARVVFLVRTHHSDYRALNILGQMFAREEDFVISFSENDVVIVKELENKASFSDIKNLAEVIVDELDKHSVVDVTVVVGSVANSLYEVTVSYRDAVVAREINKIFGTDGKVVCYNKLGIGRLIYQMPTRLCSLFLKEVFNDGNLESLDSEMLATIEKFFECNLSISETARQLFIHRNTLMYRLEKVQRLTGIDIRRFDRAIEFKMATLIKRYLNYNSVGI